MLIKKIAVLGGSGFVGHTLANRLSRDGYELRVLTRNREKYKKDLILIPNLQLVEADIHDRIQLATSLQGCDAVINLVGILNERGKQRANFETVHVELTRNLAAICTEHGIRRVLHMSALNASSSAASQYLRSKGTAEDLIHATPGLHVTSFRPSVIFGYRDSFFNRFATLLRLVPVFFPLACAGARFAPVFVEDVAEAFVRTLKDPDYYGKRLQLCGPREYTLEDLVRYTAGCIHKRRIIITLPDFVSRIQAAAFDLGGFLFNLIGVEKPFSRDNYLSLKQDSVCTCNNLELLGIKPSPVEAIVPQYLAFSITKARYYVYRQHSGRNS